MQNLVVKNYLKNLNTDMDGMLRACEQGGLFE